MTPPSGEALFNDLRKSTGLTVPDTLDQILVMIQETGEDLLEIAESVKAQKTGDGISITLTGYQLIDGCLVVGSESPACCLMNPCAICSLFGVILSEGLNTAVMIEQCSHSKKESQVEILFTLS
jgi:hypothetical protein